MNGNNMNDEEEEMLPPMPPDNLVVLPGESEQDYVNRMMGMDPRPAILRSGSANQATNDEFASQAYHMEWRRRTGQHGARRRSYRKKKMSHRKRKMSHKRRSHYKRK